MEGPVFGAADKWNGVGIFFDSFDNDGKVGWKKTLIVKIKFISCFFGTYSFGGEKIARHFSITPLPLEGLH